MSIAVEMKQYPVYHFYDQIYVLSMNLRNREHTRS